MLVPQISCWKISIQSTTLNVVAQRTLPPCHGIRIGTALVQNGSLGYERLLNGRFVRMWKADQCLLKALVPQQSLSVFCARPTLLKSVAIHCLRSTKIGDICTHLPKSNLCFHFPDCHEDILGRLQNHEDGCLLHGCTKKPTWAQFQSHFPHSMTHTNTGGLTLIGPIWPAAHSP